MYGNTYKEKLSDGRYRKLTPSALEALLEYQCQKPWLFQKELLQYLEEEWEVLICQGTLSRCLKKACISRKRAQGIGPQSEPLRVAWQAFAGQAKAEQLVFIDESLFKLATMWRSMAYAPIGDPAQYHADIRRAINGLAVCLHTLIDDGAIAFLVINSRIAQDIASYLNLSTHRLPQSFKVTGFDAMVRTIVMKYLKAHFMVDGGKFYNTPFIIADIGHYDLIMGKLFLQKFDILVDPANHRMIWADRLPPSLSVIHQRLMYPEQIRKQEINRKYQAEVDRRDANMSLLCTISKPPRQSGILKISSEQIRNAPKHPPPEVTKEPERP